MSAAEQYVLEIEWVEVDLPNLVGPFASREEAHEWAWLNIIPNGSWEVAPLAWPYLRSVS